MAEKTASLKKTIKKECESNYYYSKAERTYSSITIEQKDESMEKMDKATETVKDGSCKSTKHDQRKPAAVKTESKKSPRRPKKTKEGGKAVKTAKKEYDSLQS